MEKVIIALKSVIGKNLMAIFSDARKDLSFSREYLSESFSLILNNEIEIELSTDDNPHFWGDGTLDLKFSGLRSDHTHDQLLFSNSNPGDFVVDKIKLIRWKQDGLIIFNTFSICHAVFYFANKMILNIGLIYHKNSIPVLSGSPDLFMSFSDINLSDVDLKYEYVIIE